MPSEPANSKPWPLPVQFAFIAGAVPAIFWLRFGTVDGIAIGLTVFLLLLGAVIEFVPRAAAVAGPESHVKVTPGRYDRLGVVWVLSIPFAPFLSWVLTNLFDVGASNWRLLLGVRALLCVALPLVTVLPLVRYVRSGTAGIMIAVLVVGTGFPVATGIGSAFDVIAGPAWQDVTVVQTSDFDFKLGGQRVHAPEAVVKLSDGRSLSRSVDVSVHEGRMRLLVLRGFGRIIDALP
jgi:hypothetical protein